MGETSGNVIEFDGDDVSATSPTKQDFDTYSAFAFAFEAVSGKAEWALVPECEHYTSFTGVDASGANLALVGFGSGLYSLGDTAAMDVSAPTTNRGVVALVDPDTGVVRSLEYLGTLATPDTIPYDAAGDPSGRMVVMTGFRAGALSFNAPGDAVREWTVDNYPESSAWPESMPMLVAIDQYKMGASFVGAGLRPTTFAWKGAATTVQDTAVATGAQTVVSAVTYIDGDVVAAGSGETFSLASGSTGVVLVRHLADTGSFATATAMSEAGTDVNIADLTAARNGESICFAGSISSTGGSTVTVLGASVTLVGGSDMLVGCMDDATGDVEWLRVIGSSGDDEATDVAVSGLALVLGGSIKGDVAVDSVTVTHGAGSTVSRCALIGLDLASGDAVWGRAHGSVDASSQCTVHDLAVDGASGDIWAVGSFVGATLDLDDSNKPASPNSAKMQPFAVRFNGADQTATLSRVPSAMGTDPAGVAAIATGVAVTNDGATFVSYLQEADTLTWDTVITTKAASHGYACVLARVDLTGASKFLWTRVFSTDGSNGAVECASLASTASSVLFTLTTDASVTYDSAPFEWWPTPLQSTASIVTRWSSIGVLESKEHVGSGQPGDGTRVDDVDVSLRGVIRMSGSFGGAFTTFPGAVPAGHVFASLGGASSAERKSTSFVATLEPSELVVHDIIPTASHDLSRFVHPDCGCITDARLVVEVYVQEGTAISGATMRSPTSGVGFSVAFDSTPSVKNRWVLLEATVTAADNFAGGAVPSDYTDLQLRLQRPDITTPAPLAVRGVTLSVQPEMCYTCGNVTLGTSSQAAVDAEMLVDPTCNCLRDTFLTLTYKDDEENLSTFGVAVPKEFSILSGSTDGASADRAAVKWKCGDSPVVVSRHDGWTWIMIPLPMSAHQDTRAMDWSSVHASISSWGCAIDAISWDEYSGGEAPNDLSNYLAVAHDGPSRGNPELMEIRRMCPDEEYMAHPDPQSLDTEVVVIRTGVNLAHGERYQAITVERNVWGNELTTCGDPFLVDSTPPDVSNMTAIDMVPLPGQDPVDVNLHGQSKFRASWTGKPVDPEVTDGLFEFRINDIRVGSKGGASLEGFKALDTWVIAGAASYEEIDSDEFELPDGSTFYVELAVRNHAGLFAGVWTDGVKVDASWPELTGDILETEALPTSGSGNEDIEFQSDNTKVYGFLPAFNEPHTEVDKVMVGLGTVQTAPNALPFAEITVTAGQWTPLTLEYALQDGTTYYIIARVWNTAGAWGDYNSSGVLVDSTAPTFDYITDVFPASAQGDDGGWKDYDEYGDVAFHDGNSKVRAKFRCDDLDSIKAGEIANATYRFRVCKDDNTCAATGSVLVDWITTGEVPYGETEELGGLPGGTVIYVQVECTNPAGVTATSASNGMVVDMTPPNADAATIDDLVPGLGSNVETDQHGVNRLRAVWSGFTITSGKPGLRSYSVAVGTKPGHDDIMALTDNGMSTEWVSDEGDLALVSGGTYYVTARAITMAGAWANVTTNGVTIDLVQPNITNAVVNGTGTLNVTGIDVCPDLECTRLTDYPVTAQAGTTYFSVAFDGFVDVDSGIDYYEWGVSLCNALENYGALALTRTTSFTAAVTTTLDVELQHGVEYCAGVTAIDKVGHRSDPKFTAPVVVDITAPSISSVHVGHLPSRDKDVTSWANDFNVTFGCSDSESGIHHYEVQLTSVAAASGVESNETEFLMVEGGPSAFTARLGELGSFTLKHGDHAYVTVMCVNNAGAYSTMASQQALVDLTPPALDNAEVYHDLHAVAVDFAASKTVRASWGGFVDAESRIDYFQWAVGTAPRKSDIMRRTNVGGATVGVAENLDLEDGGTYFVTVWATNLGGLTATLSSSGFTVDLSAPTGGSVTVTPGTNGEVGFVSSVFAMEVTLADFVETHTNVTYRWAIGTSVNGEQVREFTVIPSGSLTATAEDLGLHPGEVYYVTVAATNDAGLTTLVSSQPVVADPYPPLAGEVLDGSSTSVDVAAVSASATSLSCSWTGFEDAVSGIRRWGVGLGTSPGAVDVADLVVVNDDSADTHTFDSLTLCGGCSYYCVVQCTDRAGNTVTLPSDGVTADATAPVAGKVRDGTVAGTDLDWTHHADTMSVQYPGWFDAETGIEKMEWAVGTKPGGMDVAGWVRVATHATRATRTIVGGLEAGVTYYSTIRAFNPLNFTTRVSSDGIQLLTTDATTQVSEFLDTKAEFKVLQAVPTGDATTCTCLDSNAWFFPTTAVCMCQPGFYLNEDGECSACASATSCKPSAGNDPATCVTDSSCASDDTAPSAGTFTTCAEGKQTTVPGATCECAVGTYMHVDGTCVACPTGTFKAVPGDSMELCVPCWQPQGSGVADAALLQVSWNATEAAFHQPSHFVRIGLGFGPGAAKWVVDLDPTFAGDATHLASADMPGVFLGHGAVLFATVSLVNNGTLEELASNTDMVGPLDWSPPRAGVVLDGTRLRDASTLTSPTKLSAAWHGFTDSESPLVYDVAFGEAAGGTELSGGWVRVDTDGVDADSVVRFTTDVADAKSPLADGTRVFATVRATNDAGLQVTASSNGATVAAASTPSVVVRIVDRAVASAAAASPDAAQHLAGQSYGTELHAVWSTPYAPADGVGFAWAVYDAANTTMPLVPWTSLGTGFHTGASVMDLELASNTTVFVRLRIQDGGAVAEYDSDMTVVDATAPVVTHLAVGGDNGVTVADGGSGMQPGLRLGGITDTSTGSRVYQASRTTLRVGWEATDKESGVASVLLSLGSVASGVQGMAPTTSDSPSEAEYEFTGLSMQHGHCYRVEATAVNEAGLVSDVLSSRAQLCIDATAPAASVSVKQSQYLADVAVPIGPAALTARAASLSDPLRVVLVATDTESAVVQVRYAVLDDDTAEAWADAPSSSVHTLDLEGKQQLLEDDEGVELPDALLTDLTTGVAQFVHVEVTNAAGATSHAVSSPVVVDTTAPVLEDNNVPLWVTPNEAAGLQLEWGWSDDESPLAVEEWSIALQRSAGSPLVLASGPADFPGTADVTPHNLNLESGSTYIVALQACNEAGLCANATSLLQVDSA